MTWLALALVVVILPSLWRRCFSHAALLASLGVVESHRRAVIELEERTPPHE